MYDAKEFSTIDISKNTNQTNKFLLLRHYSKNYY